MEDVLITIGIIAFVILRAYTKAKKKNAQQQARRRTAPRPIVEEPEVENEKPLWQDIFESTQSETMQEPSFETSSYEEIPKNQPYFTYEKIEPEIGEEVHNAEFSSADSVEKNVQNTDSENEKTSPISLDMEDIYKGVIYSEILKRPYN
jgi:hypothetical protein